MHCYTDLTEWCGVEILDTNTDVEEERKLLADSEDANPNDVGTFVPVVARKLSEEETIRQTVQERTTNPELVVPWPKHGDTLINEFQTEGYISCLPNAVSNRCRRLCCPTSPCGHRWTYFKHHRMYGDGPLRSTLASEILHLTPRCNDVLSRLAGCISINILEMPGSLSMTWLVVRVSVSQI